MRVVALAGGTGSAKLLRGLAAVTSDLTVVANVGDNFWFHGLYVCPDVDIAMYTLAGISDERKGWGIRGDSFRVLGQLAELGEETWFKLGDLDLATSIIRTRLLGSGRTLTEATSTLRKALGLRTPVLPATDSPVETYLVTRAGTMHIQEFWVKKRGKPRVTNVKYRGGDRASPTAQVRRALAEADRVVICPANPITSIVPILAVKGMKGLLSRCRAKVVALSPMVGSRPYSGPAGKLMRSLGVRPDSAGVAALYADFVDQLVIDDRDAGLKATVEGMGVSCALTDTRMRTLSDEKRLASVLLAA
jgi:LPPG:FO 2-phospho-L-lactate transferase